MPVSDIAKIAAMFNDNPVSQVSAYRKDAQDFFTAPDRVALDNALNYGNTQKAYEAEQRRLGQQQIDAYRSQNLYDQNTGAIRNSADIYGDAIRTGALSNMYGINAAADAARIGSQQIAATQATLGNNKAALNYLNQVGQGGAIPLSLNDVDPAVFRGYVVQGAPVSETRQFNQETTDSNRAYQQQLLEVQHAQQEKIAKLNNDRALEVAKIKIGSDAAASDQQIIADGIKLATGSDGIINKDTLTTYLTLMRGGQQVAQQGTAQNAYGGDLVDLANPTTVKPTGNPMLDAARGMNANNSGAQANPNGTQVQQQYNPFSGLTMAQLQQKALELTGDPTAQSVTTGIGTNVRRLVPNFLLSADTIGADAGRIQAIDNIRQALAAEQNRLRTADENNRAARIEQARQSSYNQSIGAK